MMMVTADNMMTILQWKSFKYVLLVCSLLVVTYLYSVSRSTQNRENPEFLHERPGTFDDHDWKLEHAYEVLSQLVDKDIRDALSSSTQGFVDKYIDEEALDLWAQEQADAFQEMADVHPNKL